MNHIKCLFSSNTAFLLTEKAGCKFWDINFGSFLTPSPQKSRMKNPLTLMT